MRKKNYTPISKGSYYIRQETPIEIVTLEDNSYHVLVSIELDGIQGKMIIDTGASISVIDRNFIRNFDHKRIDAQLQSRTINGNINDIAIVRTNSLRIGNIGIGVIKMAAIDLQQVNEMYEKQLKRTVVGLLGSDFLVKGRATIDYHRQILSWLGKRF